MWIPGHLTCLLRSMYAGQEATVRIGWTWNNGLVPNWERSTSRLSIFHPVYLTSMESKSCEMPGWMKHELESRLLEKYQQTQICRLYHSNGRKWRGTKILLMKVKEENEKAGLKLNIPKTEIMASGPITSWQIDQEKVKMWQILFSWAPGSLWTMTIAMKLKDTCSLGEKLWPT